MAVTIDKDYTILFLGKLDDELVIAKAGVPMITPVRVAKAWYVTIDCFSAPI